MDPDLSLSARKSWLTFHLEEFVRPVLGFIPTEADAPAYFTPEQMTVIKNIWRSAKRSAGGRTILLAGRDVFVFEILARRENSPTIFRPDISRLTVSYVREDYRDCMMLDTGWNGSIAKALNMPYYVLASANQILVKDHRQVFPRLTFSRALALKIEYTPKYWRRGYVRMEGTSPEHGVIFQDRSDLEEFRAAAVLTIQVYKDKSPAFIERARPLPLELHPLQQKKVIGKD